jgi:hypothetical protein
MSDTNKIIKGKKMPTRSWAMIGQIVKQIKLNTIDDLNVCLYLSLSVSF